MDLRVAELRRCWQADPADRQAFERWYASELRSGKSSFDVRLDESGLFTSVPRNPQGAREFKHVDTGIEFVEIPPGRVTLFQGGPDRSVRAAPERIQSARPYLIAKFPVTQEQWYSVMGTTPWSDRIKNGPATNISWYDADLFCQNTKLILPTDTMWLFALGNFDRTDVPEPAPRFPVPVGSHPSTHGVWDMLGNVSEWLGGEWQIVTDTDKNAIASELEDVKELVFQRFLCASWGEEEALSDGPEEERLVKYGLSLRVEGGLYEPHPEMDVDVDESPPNVGIEGIEEISPGDILADLDEASLQALAVENDLVAGQSYEAVAFRREPVRSRIGGPTIHSGLEPSAFAFPTPPKFKDNLTGFRPAWA
jgi:formylglycine-generating enzyme required for sulfatase activity